MEKQFIPYELARQLKKIGFDEPCFAGYSKDEFGSRLCLMNVLSDGLLKKPEEEDCECLAPLYQQAFKWFREKHGLRSFVDTYAQDKENDWTSFYTIKSGNGYDKEPFFSGNFKSYEKAEVACLTKLIDMVKSKSV